MAELIRMAKAAKILGIHRATLWTWVRDKKIAPALRAGDECLFDEQVIRDIAAKYTNPKRKAA